MRLLAAPDNTVNRIDRALWQTLPFDLALYLIVVPACRLVIVPFHLRTLTVAAETRALTVAAHSRVYTVSAADRVYAVGADDRTYEVTCGQ